MKLRTLKLKTSWGELVVSGGSRAGEGTLILLPQLRLALDPGRPHRALTPMTTAILSHGHADHLGGLAYWASQRYLNSLGVATLIAPQELIPSLSELLRVHAALEGGEPYEVELRGVTAGQELPLRPHLSLRFFATDHWVRTLGVEILWHKRYLKPELAHLSGAEIAQRRRAGEEVTLYHDVPILGYCADSGPQVFVDHPELTRAELLLVECSFFKDGDQERARRYGHTHLDDLLALAPQLQCRHLVLLHASRRHRLREIEETIASELAPALTCELHHLNVDWD